MARDGQLDPITGVGAGQEDEQVIAWRLLQLVRLGYPVEDAEALVAARVDHHRLRLLLAAGCSLDVARRIVL